MTASLRDKGASCSPETPFWPSQPPGPARKVLRPTGPQVHDVTGLASRARREEGPGAHFVNTQRCRLDYSIFETWTITGGSAL
jgi:hypothetical protein